MNKDGSVAKICRKTSRRLVNLMKVCEHESSRVLSGKQEGTLNESLCAQASQSLRISPDFFYYLKSRRCRHIKVNLKLEAGASESSPPSQSESSARALPDPDALTAEIFMIQDRD